MQSNRLSPDWMPQRHHKAFAASLTRQTAWAVSPLNRLTRVPRSEAIPRRTAPAATEHGAVSAALLSASSSSYPVTVVGSSLTLKWRSRRGAETIRYPLTLSGFLAMSARTAAT